MIHLIISGVILMYHHSLLRLAKITILTLQSLGEALGEQVLRCIFGITPLECQYLVKLHMDVLLIQLSYF
jgi:hypothetical protein